MNFQSGTKTSTYLDKFITLFVYFSVVMIDRKEEHDIARKYKVLNYTKENLQLSWLIL